MILMGLTTIATASPGEKPACGRYSISIVDESLSIPLHSAGADPADITDNNFKQFVAAVSTHVRTSVCVGAGDRDIRLVFIKRPLIKKAAGDHPTTEEQHGGPDPRRVSSPWVKLAISGQPVRRIDAVFIWNERQLLRDQVIMAGGAPSIKGPAVSIDANVLARYSTDYVNLVLNAPEEKADAGLDALVTRMPPEILWLYRHAVQSTFADFSVFAMAALEATLAKGQHGYADIANALFDYCFTSAVGINQHYNSVLDIKKLVNLELYRAEVVRPQ